MAHPRFTKSSKHGRTILRNNTQKLVTHLLQNEKWLNVKIGELQEKAEELKEKGKQAEYLAAVKAVEDLINSHRLFVADLLPYALPKLSATMNTDSEKALELFDELRNAGSDSATAEGKDGPKDPDGTQEDNLG
jgi:predicted house-cleaning noncanonical NTP pyrophosphatase (MazG superfamily)